MLTCFNATEAGQVVWNTLYICCTTVLAKRVIFALLILQLIFAPTTAWSHVGRKWGVLLCSSFLTKCIVIIWLFATGGVWLCEDARWYWYGAREYLWRPDEPLPCTRLSHGGSRMWQHDSGHYLLPPQQALLWSGHSMCWATQDCLSIAHAITLFQTQTVNSCKVLCFLKTNHRFTV